jgi:ketosteroid isomerase-like protein
MKYISLALLVAVMASCKNKTPDIPSFDLQQVKQIINNDNKIYRIAMMSGDSAAFADLHHSAAINMPPNQPPVNGRGPMGAIIKSMPSLGVSDYKLVSTAIYGGPDNVIEEGNYEIDTATNKVMEKGKYIVIWKPEKGKWKIYRAIWNSDSK